MKLPCPRLRSAGLAGPAAGLFLLTAASALAGDYADREILGFSADGGRFAFEEYGVQDGSGFPYSNIYLIDTDADAWVAGTPIRVRLDDEAAPLAAARADARKKAQPILDAAGIARPGTLLVSNPITERSADPLAVRFVTNPYLGSPALTWTLTLTELPFEERPPCENFGPLHGYRLELTQASGTHHLLHDDKSLPASRACPQGYAISDVIHYAADHGAPVVVVLLSVFRQGFEGPDRRFLAVAARPDPSID